MTDQSDVDLLVEADKRTKTYLNYLQAKDYFQNLLHRKIDLVYKDSLNPIIQQEIQEGLIEVE